MLHAHQDPKYPERVVILGASGVLGRTLLSEVARNGVPVLGLTSAELDLEQNGAGETLAGMLREDDALVFLSALTPDKGRDIATMMRNLRMAEAVCTALAKRPVAHTVYVSSDAVYPMGDDILTEASPAAPRDLYGAMHMTREVMMATSAPADRLAILRCTMVISAADTHNSYGPNRFRAQARQGKITLGGDGEETRDHILDQDVAALVYAVLQHGSYGILNCATGQSHSFRQVAEMVAAHTEPRPEIAGTQRTGPITHRHFDITNTHRAFPRLRFTSLHEAIVRTQAKAG